MYELMQACCNSYFLQCPAKIGLVKTGEHEVCLIDSGNDKDAGKRVKRLLDTQGWQLTAIYNTHSHADHIGGNRYLQTQTGCRIFAPGLECAFTRHPILEPCYVYGGCPPKELQHKFMLAQPSEACPLTQDALPAGWSIIPLPGHSFDMVGFRTADAVVYLADCLSGEETLNNYQIGFLVDVGAYLQTLEQVKNMQARLFVPSHADAAENIAPLAQKNIDKVYEVAERIVSVCRNGACFEDILKQLFDAYHLTLTFEQYALVGSTVRSYLTWLKNEGRLQAECRENTLIWKS